MLMAAGTRVLRTTPAACGGDPNPAAPPEVSPPLFTLTTVAYSPHRRRGVIPLSQSHARASFMTVAEVAELMRVSSMTVYRLIKAGDLAAVRVGKSFRVREDDVDRYLASRYTQAG